MLSILVAATDKLKRQEHILTYCKKLKIDSFDITVIEKSEDKQSVGIEEVKRMQEKLFLKPIRSVTKAVILDDAQYLTLEAQNALLKVLEEPPDNTIIILSAESKETFLPTILSRCQIIELQPEDDLVSEKERVSTIEFINNLATISIGGRLYESELMSKDKEKAIVMVKKIILVLREQMLQSFMISTNDTSRLSATKLKPADILQYLTAFQELYKLLKTTNINTRFAIEHTLLSILN